MNTTKKFGPYWLYIHEITPLSNNVIYITQDAVCGLRYTINKKHIWFQIQRVHCSEVHLLSHHHGILLDQRHNCWSWSRPWELLRWCMFPGPLNMHQITHLGSPIVSSLCSFRLLDQTVYKCVILCFEYLYFM